MVMLSEMLHETAEEFHKDFIALVHKHCGTDFNSVPPLLLALIQEQTSVFSPTIWKNSKPEDTSFDSGENT